MLRVERAVGQADVVEDVVDLVGGNGLADVLFDQVAESGGLFDASAAFGAEMQDERAGVAAWEEVLAEERNSSRNVHRQSSRKTGTKVDPGVHESSQHSLRKRCAPARTGAQIRAESGPGDSSKGPRCGRVSSGDTSPASAPAFAKERRRPTWRRRRLRPSGTNR